MIWMIILFVFTFSLFLLPLLPGLVELKLATDTKPLRVIQKYDTDIKYFATGFKAYLKNNFSSFFSVLSRSYIKFEEGALKNGKNFQIVEIDGAPKFTNQEISRCATEKLIISEASLVLPEKMFFETEIYSSNSVKTGAQSQLRALLAEGDIRLGEGCTIMRWVHSDSSLYAELGSNLYGRASANENITLTENCKFQRLHAKKIVFGQVQQPKPSPRNYDQTTIIELPNVKDRYGKRWSVDGNIEIPENSFFDGDLVATENITIGSGSYITGSIKSNKNLYIARGAHIKGALFSTNDLYINKDCQISGPVIAENRLVIEGGCIIGSEDTPTTISAPNITVATGVTTFGTVWADECAEVKAEVNA